MPLTPKPLINQNQAVFDGKGAVMIYESKFLTMDFNDPQFVEFVGLFMLAVAVFIIVNYIRYRRMK